MAPIEVAPLAPAPDATAGDEPSAEEPAEPSHGEAMASRSNKRVAVTSVAMEHPGRDENRDWLLPHEPLTIRVRYHASEPTEDVLFGIAIHDEDGNLLYGTNNRLAGTLPTTVALGDVNTTNYRQKPANFPNFSSLAPALNAERTGIYNSHHHFRQAPGGATTAYLPDRLYVGFQDVGTVQVVDPTTAGVVLNTIEDNALGVKRLGTYWQQ